MCDADSGGVEVTFTCAEIRFLYAHQHDLETDVAGISLYQVSQKKNPTKSFRPLK